MKGLTTLHNQKMKNAGPKIGMFHLLKRHLKVTLDNFGNNLFKPILCTSIIVRFVIVSTPETRYININTWRSNPFLFD